LVASVVRFGFAIGSSGEQPKWGNGESSVQVRRCPATVMKHLLFLKSECPPIS